MEKRHYPLMFALAIFAFVPTIALSLVFSTGVSHEKEINPEIVTGLVTVSGLIFVFQPTILRVKKTGFYRILFLAIFSGEGIMIGLVGYNFIIDALNSGYYLSGDTLLLASGSLFFNISMSAYFVLADLVIQAEDLTAF